MLQSKYLVCIFAFTLWGTARCLRFPVVGDWGANPSSSTRTRYQREVAAVMNSWCANGGCDFVVSTGDNFYPAGVTSVNDRRFDVSWNDIYTGSAIRGLTWYMSVGNHDHHYDNDGREWLQVQYSLQRNERWWQPDLYYSFQLQASGKLVHFIVLDSQSLRKRTNDHNAQIAWLETQLRSSSADWKIIIVHHPAYTSGNYGPGSSTIRNRVMPLADRYGVDVLFTGHDHNLQHISKTDGSGVDHVVSGGGSAGLYSQRSAHVTDLRNRGYTVRHFTLQYGFVGVEINSSRIKMQFYDRYNNNVYTYRRYA